MFHDYLYIIHKLHSRGPIFFFNVFTHLIRKNKTILYNVCAKFVYFTYFVVYVD